MGKFCILVGGVGSRNQIYPGLPKALLPINNRAALSYIIENIPSDWEIVLAHHYHKEEIIAYVDEVFPDRVFHHIDSGACGVGYALKRCKHLLQEPFIFTSCDTLVGECMHEIPTYDWISVDKTKSVNYAVVVDNELVRQEVHPIYTGMAGVYDYKRFWDSLDCPEGDKEVLPGLVGFKHKRFPWQDTGTDETYLSIQQKPIVPPKRGQILFIDRNKCIKWFENKEDAVHLVPRMQKFLNCKPLGTHFICWDYLPGATLNSAHDELNVRWYLNTILNDLLKSKVKVDLSEECEQMYHSKTVARVGDFLDIFPELDEIATINGKNIDSVYSLLEKIDWEDLIQNSIPVQKYHGDLQPENILIGTDTPENYVLLDCRIDFGGNTVGDLYYDLGKYMHACIVSNQIILNGGFEVLLGKDSAVLELEFNNFLLGSLDTVAKFCELHHLNQHKVGTIAALHFLSISPLYPKNPKYSKFLFLLGKYLLANLYA
jgi:hypothetical protein